MPFFFALSCSWCTLYRWQAPPCWAMLPPLIFLLLLLRWFVGCCLHLAYQVQPFCCRHSWMELSSCFGSSAEWFFVSVVWILLSDGRVLPESVWRPVAGCESRTLSDRNSTNPVSELPTWLCALSVGNCTASVRDIPGRGIFGSLPLLVSLLNAQSSSFAYVIVFISSADIWI